MNGLGGTENGFSSVTCAVKPFASCRLPPEPTALIAPVPEVFFIFLYMTGAPGYSPRVFQEGNDSFQL